VPALAALLRAPEAPADARAHCLGALLSLAQHADNQPAMANDSALLAALAAVLRAGAGAAPGADAGERVKASLCLFHLAR